MRKLRLKSIYLFTLAAVLLVAMIFCVLTLDTGVAYAYDLVFPSSGYFQSEHPTLIAANEDWLLVYDESQSTLYARSNAQVGTKSFAADVDATSLFAVGDKAFFVTDTGYKYLDVSLNNATLQDVALPTPDDITYVTTDGTYLYAVSSWGYVTIYDENFAPALGQDNARNLALTGDHVLLGSEDVLYIFKTSYGEPHYTILNLASGTTEERAMSVSVQAASVGDNAVIFALVGGQISVLDKPTGTMLLTSEIEPDAFSSYGRNLFTVKDDVVSIYTLSQDNTELTLTSSLRMTGNDAKHFNHPLDVVKLSNKLAVADSLNNRIAYFDASNELLSAFALDAEPYALAQNGGVLYIATASQILKLDGIYVEQRYDVTGVLDLVYLDKLYVLKADGVYTLASGEIGKLCDVQNPLAISSAFQGSNVFVLTADEIIVIDKNGNKLPTSLVGNFAGAKALAVDYGGNPIVAYENKIEVYTNQIGSLSLKNTQNLDGELRATLNSCALDDTTLYFTTDESFIGKVTLDVETSDLYPDAGGQGEAIFVFPYSFKKATNLSTAYILPFDKRKEGIGFATDETYIVFEGANAPDGYWLAYNAGHVFFVPQNAFENVATQALSGEYVATKETRLNGFLPNWPHETDVVLQEGEHVNFVSTTAGYDGGAWVIVRYNNTEYFAKQGDFAEYVAPVPERKTEYGRAKGSRVGGVVNVYQSADESSVVILEVADGTKLEILDEQGDFYQVKIGETIGYMRKGDVELGALTSVQIVAIVLAIAVLLAGTTIFAAIYLTKKKSENR